MKTTKFWDAAQSRTEEASRCTEASSNVRKEAALAAGGRPPQPDSLRTRFQNAINLLHCTLREIFDESAYARFLARRQIATSPQAYADFLREMQAQRERRPRCC